MWYRVSTEERIKRNEIRNPSDETPLNSISLTQQSDQNLRSCDEAPKRLISSVAELADLLGRLAILPAWHHEKVRSGSGAAALRRGGGGGGGGGGSGVRGPPSPKSHTLQRYPAGPRKNLLRSSSSQVNRRVNAVQGFPACWRFPSKAFQAPFRLRTSLSSSALT